MPENSTDSFKSRDGIILRLLGGFFLAFGVLVWIGLFWPQEPSGRLVNVGAGAVLFLVGGLSIWLGRRP